LFFMITHNTIGNRISNWVGADLTLVGIPFYL
jgi:hypothetical protein